MQYENNCINRVKVESCTFCNGDWDRSYYEILPVILKDKVDWNLYSQLEASTFKAIREMEFFVNAELKLFIYRTSLIPISSVDDLEGLALSLDRTFGHMLWLYFQMWYQKYNIKQNSIIVPQIYANTFPLRHELAQEVKVLVTK